MGCSTMVGESTDKRPVPATTMSTFSLLASAIIARNRTTAMRWVLRSRDGVASAR